MFHFIRMYPDGFLFRNENGFGRIKHFICSGYLETFYIFPWTQPFICMVKSQFYCVTLYTHVPIRRIFAGYASILIGLVQCKISQSFAHFFFL